MKSGKNFENKTDTKTKAITNAPLEEEIGFSGAPVYETSDRISDMSFDGVDATDEAVPPRHRRQLDGVARASLILRIIVIVVATLILGLYIYDKHEAFTPYNLPPAILCFVLIVVATCLAIPNIVRMFTGNAPVGMPAVKNVRRRFLTVCLVALLIRTAMTAIGMLFFDQYTGHVSGSLFNLWRAAWMKNNTDAQHYLKIAEMGYVRTGNDRLLIVFFPMFPMLIRFLGIIFRDGFISAQIINTVAGCLAAGMLYLTFSHIMDEKRAFFSAIIALLLPGMIFMNSPMTEPLFLLFTACCFYFIQKERLLLSGLFAALAGLTRSVGVLLAVPIALQGICLVVRSYREHRHGTRRLMTVLLALVISTLGTLTYLFINKSVTGDPLRFLEYQKSNWSQGFYLFADTPRYMMDYLLRYLKYGDVKTAVSLSICGLAAIFGSAIICVFTSKRLPATYVAFFIAYFIMAVSCTWLLSAVRYLCALLPLSAAVGILCKRKWQRATALSLCTLMSVAYIGMYMYQLSIY